MAEKEEDTKKNLSDLDLKNMQRLMSIELENDELNDKMGGGIPINSIMLIEAENGLGKSALAQRFMYGLIKNGKTITYISTELTARGFVKQMDSLNYRITEELLNDKVLFLSAYPTLGNVEFEKDFFSKMMGTKQIFEKDVIIIDTFSNLLVDKEINEEDVFKAIKFLKELASLGKVIVFCVEPNEIPQQFISYLRGVTDIYIKLEFKEQYGVQIRLMSVERFVGAGGDIESPLAFKVMANVGLALEIASSA